MRLDGFSSMDVQQIKLFYTQLMHALGTRLRLRQRVVCTAVVFWRRFFTTHTLLAHDPLLLAAAALWMSGKVEESSVAATRVVRELDQLGLGRGMLKVEDLYKAEYTLLEVVKSNLAVTHPHDTLSRLLAAADLRESLGVERSDCLVQAAFFLCNDCFRTDVLLTAAPYCVALGCALAAGLLEHTNLLPLLVPAPSAEDVSAAECVAAELLALYETSTSLAQGDLIRLHQRLSQAGSAVRSQQCEEASGAADNRNDDDADADTEEDEPTALE